MALLPPIANAILTQSFGPSKLSVEPHMYANATKANFLAEAGLAFHEHFHSALDLAAPFGTPILASETGKVVFSGLDPGGGGNKIQVLIRPNVSYASNHCSALLVQTGAVVSRGQPIARVGATGLATGNHDHFWVEIDELVAGRLRHNYYDPALFLPGGAMANSELVAPANGVSYVQLNGPNANVRTAPTLQLSSIYASSKADGIHRLGKVIAPLNTKMRFGGWASGDGLIWAKAYLGGTYRFIWKSLIHFV